MLELAHHQTSRGRRREATAWRLFLVPLCVLSTLGAAVTCLAQGVASGDNIPKTKEETSTRNLDWTRPGADEIAPNPPGTTARAPRLSDVGALPAAVQLPAIDLSRVQVGNRDKQAYVDDDARLWRRPRREDVSPNPSAGPGARPYLRALGGGYAANQGNVRDYSSGAWQGNQRIDSNVAGGSNVAGTGGGNSIGSGTVAASGTGAGGGIGTGAGNAVGKAGMGTSPTSNAGPGNAGSGNAGQGKAEQGSAGQATATAGTAQTGEGRGRSDVPSSGTGISDATAVPGSPSAGAGSPAGKQGAESGTAPGGAGLNRKQVSAATGNGTNPAGPMAAAGTTTPSSGQSFSQGSSQGSPRGSAQGSVKSSSSGATSGTMSSGASGTTDGSTAGATSGRPTGAGPQGASAGVPSTGARSGAEGGTGSGAKASGDAAQKPIAGTVPGSADLGKLASSVKGDIAGAPAAAAGAGGGGAQPGNEGAPAASPGASPTHGESGHPGIHVSSRNQFMDKGTRHASVSLGRASLAGAPPSVSGDIRGTGADSSGGGGAGTQAGQDQAGANAGSAAATGSTATGSTGTGSSASGSTASGANQAPGQPGGGGSPGSMTPTASAGQSTSGQPAGSGSGGSLDSAQGSATSGASGAQGTTGGSASASTSTVGGPAGGQSDVQKGDSAAGSQGGAKSQGLAQGASSDGSQGSSGRTSGGNTSSASGSTGGPPGGSSAGSPPASAGKPGGPAAPSIPVPSLPAILTRLGMAPPPALPPPPPTPPSKPAGPTSTPLQPPPSPASVQRDQASSAPAPPQTPASTDVKPADPRTTVAARPVAVVQVPKVPGTQQQQAAASTPQVPPSSNSTVPPVKLEVVKPHDTGEIPKADPKPDPVQPKTILLQTAPKPRPTADIREDAAKLDWAAAGKDLVAIRDRQLTFQQLSPERQKNLEGTLKIYEELKQNEAYYREQMAQRAANFHDQEAKYEAYVKQNNRNALIGGGSAAALTFIYGEDTVMHGIAAFAGKATPAGEVATVYVKIRDVEDKAWGVIGNLPKLGESLRNLPENMRIFRDGLIVAWMPTPAIPQKPVQTMTASSSRERPASASGEPRKEAGRESETKEAKEEEIKEKPEYHEVGKATGEAREAFNSAGQAREVLRQLFSGSKSQTTATPPREAEAKAGATPATTTDKADQAPATAKPASAANSAASRSETAEQLELTLTDRNAGQPKQRELKLTDPKTGERVDLKSADPNPGEPKQVEAEPTERKTGEPEQLELKLIDRKAGQPKQLELKLTDPKTGQRMKFQPTDAKSEEPNSLETKPLLLLEYKPTKPKLETQDKSSATSASASNAGKPAVPVEQHPEAADKFTKVAAVGDATSGGLEGAVYLNDAVKEKGGQGIRDAGFKVLRGGAQVGAAVADVFGAEPVGNVLKKLDTAAAVGQGLDKGRATVVAARKGEWGEMLSQGTGAAEIFVKAVPVFGKEAGARVEALNKTTDSGRKLLVEIEQYKNGRGTVTQIVKSGTDTAGNFLTIGTGIKIGTVTPLKELGDATISSGKTFEQVANVVEFTKLAGTDDRKVGLFHLGGEVRDDKQLLDNVSAFDQIRARPAELPQTPPADSK